MPFYDTPAFLTAPLPASFLSRRPTSRLRRSPCACARPPASSRSPPPPPPSPRSLDAAISALSARRADSTAAAPSLPTVHLVGTGPGDPSMLTLGAVSLMQRADVVLYDRLVTPSILSYVADDATMVYVGKEKGYHTRSQDEIHELLQTFAAEKKDAVIVRLKGGDPFVFGRGGEEVAFLEENGVHVEVTPGITAAAGIAARIGVPLTMRGVAEAVKFVTGHRANGEAGVGDVDPVSFEVGTTLVVYMGLGGVETLVDTLVAQGMSKDTPAVAVERGTTPEENVVWGRVRSIAEAVHEQRLASPTLFVLGDVVRCAPGWNAWAADESNQVFLGDDEHYVEAVADRPSLRVEANQETPVLPKVGPVSVPGSASAPNC